MEFRGIFQRAITTGTALAVSIAASATALAQAETPAPEGAQTIAVQKEEEARRANEIRERIRARVEAARARAAREAAQREQAVERIRRFLVVPPPPVVSRPPSLPAATAPGLGKLDLNAATLEQIQRLRGVGLEWAPLILAGRPYRTFGDIARRGVPFPVVNALSDQVELLP